MMRKLLIAVLVVFAAGSSFAAANSYGVRGGFSFSPDQFVIGGQAEVNELSPNLWFVPKVEAGFGDDFTNIYLFGTVLYTFRNSRTSSSVGGNPYIPYVGGGLGFTIWKYDIPANYPANLRPYVDDSGSDFGLTAIGGIKKMLDARKELFFEIEIGLSDHTTDIKLMTGLNFF